MFSVLLLALGVLSPVFAQIGPDSLWSCTYGGNSYEYLSCALQLNNGGYLLAGSTNSFGADSGDCYVVRTDSAGLELWSAHFGNADNDYGNDAILTSDGNILISGVTDVDAQAYRLYLVKLTLAGDTLWTRTHSGNYGGYFSPVIETPDGGFAIACESWLSGTDQMCLVRTDGDGNLLWWRAFGANSTEYAQDIMLMPDGGFILVGPTYSFTPEIAAYLVRTNSSGDTLWTRVIGGEEITFFPQCLARTHDGGFAITGYTYDWQGSSRADVQLTVTDSGGNVLWSRIYGTNEDEYSSDVREMPDHGFLLSGYMGDYPNWEFLSYRTDGSGEVAWRKSFTGPQNDYGVGGMRTAEGGYAFYGATESYGHGSRDMYLIKTTREPMHLTFPNGGDFHPNEQIPVRWISAGGGEIALEVNLSYPSDEWELVTAAAPNAGYYSWLAGDRESWHVRFRITHLTDTTQTDTTDADVRLLTPRIRLTDTTPDTLLTGIRDTVRFERVFVVDPLRLEIMRDYPAGSWELLTDQIITDSVALWTTSLPESDHCRLRLVSILHSEIGDTLDSDFVLRAPHMEIVQPNGSEILYAGLPFDIQWEASEHQGNVAVLLNRDYPEGTWTTLAVNTQNDGHFDWTPSLPTTSRARVRVRTQYDPQTFAESAADFEIAANSTNRQSGLPAEFALLNPYPNPFNAHTEIGFVLPSESHLTLSVYDVTGRQIVQLLNAPMSPGEFHISFDGRDLPSGLYIYELRTSYATACRKMLLLK